MFADMNKFLFELTNPKEHKLDTEVVEMERCGGVMIDYAIVLRPYAKEFLRSLSSHYNIVIYANDYYENMKK